ncbi:MAG TPA: Hpt domain-containing protein [Cyclobacteriaceae bacterium]|nr:Hpt domain-containing protein [Cyclobacteriaceae bacterium]
MLFDLTKLEKNTGNNHMLAIEAIEYFIESIPEGLQQIKKAINSHRWSRAADTAHQMLTTVSIVGITEMRKPLEDIEKLALKEHSNGKIDHLLDQIGKLYAESYVEMQLKQKELQDKI